MKLPKYKIKQIIDGIIATTIFYLVYLDELLIRTVEKYPEYFEGEA